MTASDIDVERLPVLVGVDGSDRNLAAVRWAAREAVRYGVPLRLMCVLDEYSVLSPELHAVSVKPWAHTAVTQAARVAEHLFPDLETSAVVTAGVPATLLAEESAFARLLVLGRHGAGRFTRLLLGSTTTTAASHALTDVAVVPADWPLHREGRVVAGVTPEHAGTVLHQAFEVAQRREAPLLVVHAWELHPEFSWDASAVSYRLPEWERVARHRLQESLEPWAAKYPTVPVEIDVPRGHPAQALVNASDDSALLVVGAHHGRGSGHQRLGSVARAVLHHASVPVMVVRES